MAQFTSAGGGGVPVSASIVGAASGLVSNVAMTTADTEYSFVLPEGTKKFTLKLRDYADLKIALTAAASGTTYLTVPRGVTYSEDALTTVGTTLYFQSPQASQVLEIITWA